MATQVWLIVKSGIASFIVTLGGLFFLRGVTEVSYRAFNRAPDQTAGSTTVTELPDIKNIINVPGHGEMERDAAKMLPNDQLLEILSNVPANTVAKLTQQLTYINEKVATSKTSLAAKEMIRAGIESVSGNVSDLDEFFEKQRERFSKKQNIVH